MGTLRGPLFVVTVLVGVASLGGLVSTIVLRSSYESVDEWDFGIVIDAGSSHSDLTIFTWPHRSTPDTPLVEEAPPISQVKWTCATKPGISSFAEDPSQAGASLQPCLAQAEHDVPQGKWSTTPLILGATAGMRLLQATNPAQAEAVLESVRLVMSQTPFLFYNSSARIISGTEEGAFGWVQVNYLLGLLTASVPGGSLPPTVGALDLGGASTQISFVPANASEPIPAGYEYTESVYGHTYSLYTHSFLYYGLLEARYQLEDALIAASNASASVVVDPCVPSGYNYTSSAPASNDSRVFVGSSDPAACTAQVRLLFNKTAPCPSPPCSFNGVFEPPPVDSFYAFSGYVYPIEFLNLTSTASLPQLAAATASACALSWAQVSQMPPHNPDLLSNYCFQATYAYQLMSYGFGLSNSTALHFDTSVAGTSLGWSLGLMINATSLLPVYPPEPRERRMSKNSAAVVGAVSTAGVVLCVVVLVFLLKNRRSRPHGDFEYAPI